MRVASSNQYQEIQAENGTFLDETGKTKCGILRSQCPTCADDRLNLPELRSKKWHAFVSNSGFGRHCLQRACPDRAT